MAEIANIAQLSYCKYKLPVPPNPPVDTIAWGRKTNIKSLVRMSCRPLLVKFDHTISTYSIVSIFLIYFMPQKSIPRMVTPSKRQVSTHSFRQFALLM